MKNKGLCITCVNDKGCTLSRKFPVLQCEEFTNYESRPLKAKRRKNKIQKVAEIDLLLRACSVKAV